MFPNLSSLSIGALDSNSSTEPSTKRGRMAETTLGDLPSELLGLVLAALAGDDCVAISNLCGQSKEFAAICREDAFWKRALINKGWMPDWSSADMPGGLTPRRYYEMVCGLEEGHRRALCELKIGSFEIKLRAFEGCTSLALTHLPDSLFMIHEHAFEGCTSLALKLLPDTLSVIGDGAFLASGKLAGEFEEAVSAINSLAFHRVEELED